MTRPAPTIAAKLAAINPPPPPRVAERQKQIARGRHRHGRGGIAPASRQPTIRWPSSKASSPPSTATRTSRVFAPRATEPEALRPAAPVAPRPSPPAAPAYAPPPPPAYAPPARDALPDFGADEDEDDRPALPPLPDEDEQFGAAPARDIDPFQKTRQKPRKRISGGLIAAAVACRGARHRRLCAVVEPQRRRRFSPKRRPSRPHRRNEAAATPPANATQTAASPGRMASRASSPSA